MRGRRLLHITLAECSVPGEEGERREREKVQRAEKKNVPSADGVDPQLGLSF